MKIKNVIFLIEAFLNEWHRSPFLWETEADIQAELYGRLKKLLFESNELTQNIYYPKYGYIDVCLLNCAHKVNLPNNDYCFPDIIITKKICDIEKSPDEEDGVNWPIYCAFELKYITEVRSGDNLKNNKWDIDKLISLLDCNNAEYGVVIHIKRSTKGTKGKTKLKKSKNNRLFHFQVN